MYSKFQGLSRNIKPDILAKKIYITVCIIIISLNRPENQLSCGVYYVYETVRVI